MCMKTNISVKEGWWRGPVQSELRSVAGASNHMPQRGAAVPYQHRVMTSLTASLPRTSASPTPPPPPPPPRAFRCATSPGSSLASSRISPPRPRQTRPSPGARKTSRSPHNIHRRVTFIDTWLNFVHDQAAYIRHISHSVAQWSHCRRPAGPRTGRLEPWRYPHMRKRDCSLGDRRGGVSRASLAPPPRAVLSAPPGTERGHVRSRLHKVALAHRAWEQKSCRRRPGSYESRPITVHEEAVAWRWGHAYHRKIVIYGAKVTWAQSKLDNSTVMNIAWAMSFGNLINVILKLII